MAFLHDDVYDNGLQTLTDNVDAIHVCSQAPTTYAEATSTYSRGSKSSPTIGSPVDGVSSGRRVIITGFTDGTASSTGNITHLAIVDTGSSKLLAVQALIATQYVVSGDPLSLGTFSVGVPDIS